jgi:hypothetical protein
VAGSGRSGSSGDGGQAGVANLWFPTDVAFDSAGNLLIVDRFSSVVRKVAAITPQITVSLATPTVTVRDAGGTYKGAAFAATATVAGINTAAGASLEGVRPALTYYVGAKASGTGSAAVPSAAGTYTVMASFAGSTDYCAASSQTTFTISRATLTVSGISANNKTYDGNTTAQLNRSSAKLNGAVKGDVVSLVTSGAVGTFATKNVGSNAVQVAGLSLSGAQASNYVIAAVTTKANITATRLTISALNAIKTYGNADPTFAVSYAGFVAGEGAGVLGGHVTFKTNESSATAAAPGRYTITPSGLTSTNYAIAFVNGALTVSKAPSAITVKIYSSTTTSATFTATVAPLAPGGGVLSGTVTFIGASTNRILGKATLSKGVASCKLQYSASTRTITASYSGDGNFTASAVAAAIGNIRTAAATACYRRGLAEPRRDVDSTLSALNVTSAPPVKGRTRDQGARRAEMDRAWCVGRRVPRSDRAEFRTRSVRSTCQEILPRPKVL